MMSIWSKLFGVHSHTADVCQRLRLESLCERALPSTMAAEPVEWQGPMLAAEQSAAASSDPALNTESGTLAVNTSQRLSEAFLPSFQAALADGKI